MQCQTVHTPRRSQPPSLRHADAEAAVAALVEAGISPSSIELEHGVLAEARGREGRFVWRVLVIIVLWSIVGGVLGAAARLAVSPPRLGPKVQQD